MANQTTVIVKNHPLADFLDTIPEKIMDWKMHTSELDWKAEQKELDREYQRKTDEQNYKISLVGTYLEKDLELKNTMSSLGIISMQNENLKDDSKTENAESFTNRAAQAYSLGEEELKQLTSDLVANINTSHTSIASYNKGKNLFSEIDLDDSGKIDPNEKIAYTEKYANEPWDFAAFEQGIYASEYDAAQVTALKLDQEKLVQEQLRGEYLPGQLESDKTFQIAQIKGMNIDNESKLAQLELTKQNYEKGKLDLALLEMQNTAQQLVIDTAEFELSEKELTSLATGAEGIINQGKASAKSVSLQLLSQLGLRSRDKAYVQPIYDWAMDQIAEGSTLTDGWDNLVWDPWVGREGEYGKNFQQWKDALGVEYGSIEDDLKGFIQAFDMGWGEEGLTNPELFLSEADKIFTELNELKYDNPLVMDMKNVFKAYKLDSNQDWHEDVNGFVEYVNMAYAEGMDNVDFQDVIGFGRYIQFMEMGFLEGDALESSRYALELISAGSARLNQINAQKANIKIK